MNEKMKRISDKMDKLLRGISYIDGYCVVCGKMLFYVLPSMVVIKSYSKRYMTKKGYDGIRIMTNDLFDKKYKTNLDAILCLDCFIIAKKEYGWHEGPHYNPDSDVL